MIFRIKNIITTVLIIAFVTSSFAYKANAGDFFAAFKFSIDIAVKSAMRGVFQSVANKVVGKLQDGGVDGGTAFVQNWRNFQLLSQNRGEDVFRGILSSTNLCNYFGNDLKDLFGAKQRINLSQVLTRTSGFDSFQVKAGCTLPSNFDFEDYKQDFSGNGGWEAWVRLMEPQNNYYGVLFQSLGEAGRQRALEESAAVNQAVAGGGVLGLEECLTRGINGKCLVSKIKTPGSILGASVEDIFKTNLDFIRSAEGVSGIITFASQFIIDRLFDLGGSESSGGTIDTSSAGNLEKSYKNEFCSVADNMITDPTALWIQANYPEAFKAFPPEEDINSSRAFDDNDVGKSFCEQQKRDDNQFPYNRCLDLCFRAVGLYPDVNTVSPFTEPPPPSPSSEEESPSGEEEFHAACVPDDPPETDFSCRMVPGPGPSTCSVDRDCN